MGDAGRGRGDGCGDAGGYRGPLPRRGPTVWRGPAAVRGQLIPPGPPALKGPPPSALKATATLSHAAGGVAAERGHTRLSAPSCPSQAGTPTLLLRPPTAPLCGDPLRTGELMAGMAGDGVPWWGSFSTGAAQTPVPVVRDPTEGPKLLLVPLSPPGHPSLNRAPCKPHALFVGCRLAPMARVPRS